MPLAGGSPPDIAAGAAELPTGLACSSNERVVGGLLPAVDSRSELANGEAAAAEGTGSVAGGFESGGINWVTGGVLRGGSSASDSLDLRLAFPTSGLKPELLRGGADSSNPELRAGLVGLPRLGFSAPAANGDSGLASSLPDGLPGGIVEGESFPVLASLKPAAPPVGPG